MRSDRLLLLFFLLWSLCSLGDARAQSLQAEAKALLKWRDSLQDAHVLNSSWSFLKSRYGAPCQWDGIQCSSDKTSVVKISLQNKGLRGTLNYFDFAAFPNLAHFDLRGNNLNGSIPDGIGNLSKLTFLDLSVNQFSGSLPVTMANVTQISEFWISDNFIDGELIPSFFTNWRNLTRLVLFGNKLTGNIPLEIGQLEKLTRLDLAHNLFQDQSHLP
uniref:Leucine-rich repeat-containing N-terminal plant-type domain-containing protein n=1 Tax=Nymphaea colorata TaxID=210225 RepID=A0A5K0W451_9MAGN